VRGHPTAAGRKAFPRTGLAGRLFLQRALVAAFSPDVWFAPSAAREGRFLGGWGSGSALEDRLDLDLDADFLAHQQTAGLEDNVPGDAEVLPVDLGAGGEDGAVVAPGGGCVVVGW
jgi:hypothetical protein